MWNNEAIFQRGTSFDELQPEIRGYYRKNATDENPLPLNVETAERIERELMEGKG